MDDSSFVFLAINDSLKHEAFKTDPSILIPIACGQDGKIPDPENISWENILSGMLKIISSYGNKMPVPGSVFRHGDIISADETDHIPPEWVEYYRRLVLSVKPEIYHEFTSASIAKAQNGEYDLALEINAVLEGIFPGSPGVVLNRAIILENKASSTEKNLLKGNKGKTGISPYRAAEEAYEKAMAMEPLLPDSFFNAGFFYLRLKDYERAADCLSRYIKTVEESAFAEAIGEENPGENRDSASREKIKQARKILKEILQQGFLEKSFHEAYDLIDGGEEEKGLLKIREFIEKYPRVWNGWFVLGWALRKLGRYEDGLNAFKKAAEFGGKNNDVMNETAICLMELGDLKAARKELEHALRNDPEDIKIISNLGVLAMKAGSTDEAKAFFRTVLDLDENDPLAKHYLQK